MSPEPLEGNLSVSPVDRVRLFAQTVSEVLYEWDPETGRLSFLRPLPPALGYQAEELATPEDWRRLIHPEDAPAFAAAVENALEQTGAFDSEYRILSRSGEVRFCRDRASVLRDASGRPCRWFGSFLDRTDERRAEDALCLSEARFRALFQVMAQGVVCRDPDGRIIAMNSAAERILGVSLAEVRAHPGSLIFCARDGSPLPSEEDPSTIALRTGTERRGEVLGFRRPGSAELRWVQVDTIPRVFSGDGRARFVYSIFLDVTGQKRLEDSLREQKEFLRGILDNMPAMIIAYDPAGKAKFVNREWEHVLGRPDQASPAAEILERLCPDPHAPGAFSAAVPGWADVDVVALGGERLNTSWRTARLSDGTLLGIGQDVTERKRTEARLRDLELRFRCLINANVLGIVIADRDGRITYANEAFLQLLGYQPSDLILEQLTWGVLVTPEHEAAEISAREQISRTGVCQPYETEYLHRDGRRVPVLVGGALMARPETLAVYFVVDLSQQRRAEEFRAKLGAIVESSDDPIVSKTLEGVITSWNPAAETLYGYAAEEVLGRPVSILYPPERAAECERILEAVRQGQAVRHLETARVAKDGARVDISLTVSPIRDSSGRIVGAASIARDISQRKLVERQLRASHSQMRSLAAHVERARERERTRVAREIHDELGQSLTVLKMELEGLAAKVAGKPQLKDVAAKLDSMAEHAKQSIQWVRRVSSELRPGILDHLGLTAAIEWQARDFQKRTQIECQFGELPELNLDPDRSTAVFRIFQEVLTNVARHAGATLIRIQLSVDDGTLVLRIADNGKGIDPVHVSSTRSLGLLGMRERALLFRGSVSFAGAPGQGTTVTLRVPVDSAEAGSEPPEWPDQHTDGLPIPKQLRILVADDHTIFRQGLKELLFDRLGAEVSEAADGNEAITAFQRGVWDLVVLDIAMPGRSGLAVLKHIRSAGHATPVLVVSTHSEDQYGEPVLRAGGSGYVSKSRSTEELMAGIEAALAGGRFFSATTVRRATVPARP